MSANQVTIWCLITGLVAGNLFFYASPGLNALGFVMFIISDVFDSADGQLARLRQSYSPFGKLLDGLSDSLRWINLYVTLGLRLGLDSHYRWEGAALAFAALVLHSVQASAIEFIRGAYQSISDGDGPVDLPEDIPVDERRSPLGRLGAWLHRGYLRRQAQLFPGSAALVRALRQSEIPESFRESYRERQRPLLPHCAWLGHNIHFLLLGIFCIPGWPAGYLWMTILPLGLIAFGLIQQHERNAATLLHRLTERKGALAHAW